MTIFCEIMTIKNKNYIMVIFFNKFTLHGYNVLGYQSKKL